MASMTASPMPALHLLSVHPEVPLAILASLFIGYLFWRKGDHSLVYFPIVGMLPSLLLSLHRVHDWITSVMQERGCTFRFRGPWFSRMNYLVTSDPQNVKYITSSNFNNYFKGTSLREEFDVFGISVTTSDFDEWRIRRRVIRDLLHQPWFLRCTRRVVHDKLEKDLLPLLSHFAKRGEDVDMREVLKRFTFDVMCLLLYGVDLGSVDPSFPAIPFLTAMDNVLEASFLRFAVPRSWWKLLRWLRMGWERKLYDSIEIVDDFIGEVITSRKGELSKSSDAGPEESEAPSNLLACFIRHQKVDETGKFSSDKSIRDHTLELLTAGRDSTSLVLAWLVWIVSQHPAVETKIVDELVASLQGDVTSRCGGQKYVFFGAEELDRCVYLNAAIHESLRLFPTVPIAAPRWVLHEDILPSGDKVEPGTAVMFCPYAMGRMEKNWGEDRLDFKPERWISKEGKLREESSYKLPGFGAGPRICLGKNMALPLVRTVAAAVLYNFRFQVAEGIQVSPKSNVVLHMKNGLMGSLRERFHA